jgi:AAA domain
VLLEGGAIGQVRRWQVLRTVAGYPTRREAQALLDERLRAVNAGASPPEASIAFGTFVEEQWKALVLPTFKASTQHGYKTTLRAAHKLAEAVIESSTLQRHLSRGDEQARPSDQKRLYVLDESSLASTKQIHTFLERLSLEHCVLLRGDVRQHEAVDAGAAVSPAPGSGHPYRASRRDRAAARCGVEGSRRRIVSRKRPKCRRRTRSTRPRA